MCFFDFPRIVSRQTFRLDSKYVSDFIVVVDTKSYSVISCPPRSPFSLFIGIVQWPSSKPLIYELEVLKFLFMEPKKEGRNSPVVVTMSAPMLHSNDSKDLSQITLKRYSMEQRGVVSRWIQALISKRRKGILKAMPQSPAGVLKSLVKIESKLRLKCS